MFIEHDKPTKLLYTATEAAEALAISPRTLWSWTNNGVIRSVRIGAAVRYTLDELREFIAKQTHPPV